MYSNVLTASDGGSRYSCRKLVTFTRVSYLWLVEWYFTLSDPLWILKISICQLPSNCLTFIVFLVVYNLWLALNLYLFRGNIFVSSYIISDLGSLLHFSRHVVSDIISVWFIVTHPLVEQSFRNSDSVHEVFLSCLLVLHHGLRSSLKHPCVCKNIVFFPAQPPPLN